jgi:hypothetical protein
MSKNNDKRHKQEVIASIASIVIIVLAIVIGIVAAIRKEIYNTKIENLLAKVEDTDDLVVLPNEIYLVNGDNLDSTVVGMIQSDEYTTKEKRQMIELLAMQGVDTTNMVIAYNEIVTGKKMEVPESSEEESSEESEESSDESEYDEIELAEADESSEVDESKKQDIINFLDSSGLTTSVDSESTDTNDSGISLLGAKTAISYQNLYQAEKGFGARLGLLFTVDALENYEMVSAYTVSDEFLQCVYAVNQDGTALRDDEDIEEEEINTLTVKLSLTEKTDELKTVYNDYDLQFTKAMISENETEEVEVYFYGTDKTTINLICLDMNSGRSYCIHTANGISDAVADNLVQELLDTLDYINEIQYNEETEQ